MENYKEEFEKEDDIEKPARGFSNVILNVQRYGCEKDRLDSFKNWPCLFVKPEDLAKAGFYYLNDSDKVRCAYCNLGLCNWEPGDIPIKEHCRYLPSCKFIKTIPLGHCPISTEDHSLNEVKNKIEEEISIGSRENDQYLASPNLAKTTWRLNTFNSYPKCLKQITKSLAEAGFYYAGDGDHVHCFSCGGVLKCWELNANPWNEHARWFRTCPFLLDKKGKDFVTQHSLPPNLSRYCSQPLPEMEESICRRVNRCITSDIVQAVVEVGLDLRFIRRAIARRLKDKGTPFPDSDTLYESVLDELLPESKEELIGNCPQGSMTTIAGLQPCRLCSSTCCIAQTSQNENLSSAVLYSSSEPASEHSKSDPLLEELCLKCNRNGREQTFVDCGHFLYCTECADKVTECPLCGQSVVDKQRTYLS